MFVVEYLIHGKLETVHVARLALYRAVMDVQEVYSAIMRYEWHSETFFQDEKEIRSIRDNRERLEIQIEWEGLTDNVDPTWEPTDQV